MRDFIYNTPAHIYVVKMYTEVSQIDKKSNAVVFPRSRLCFNMHCPLNHLLIFTFKAHLEMAHRLSTKVI
mgnify:FL=1